MSLLLTSPPAVEPITLAEVKAHLRVDHADDDVFISNLIAGARRQIEARTSLSMIQQGWSVFYDQWPLNDCLTVPLDPVATITEIRIYGDDDTFAVLDPSHYFVDPAAWPARIVLRHGCSAPQPGRSANGIEIRVTAGFGATPAAVPQELKQAVLLTVASWFAHRGDEHGGSLPLMAQALIQPYHRVRLK